MAEYLESKPDENDNSKSENEKENKPESKPASKDKSKPDKFSRDRFASKDKSSKPKSPSEGSSDKSTNKKNNSLFSNSAKVFDDEVYTIIGSLETAKINYVKGEVGSLKEQMFTTEKQLEGVHNVLFLALSKLGLIDPNAKSPFQREIREL